MTGLSLTKNLEWTRLGVCQVLVGLVFVSLYFSPALSNLFEIVAFLLVATSKPLRGRVRDFISSPLAKYYGFFLLVLILGASNGMLRGNSDLSEMWGWRKILLLPLGAAIFMGEDSAKRYLALGFLMVSVLFAFWANVNAYLGLDPVVAKNYAIQGMFFTVAILFCIEFYFVSTTFKVKLALTAAVGLLTVSVFFLTSGRSGYLAWLVGIPVCLMVLRLPVNLLSKLIIVKVAVSFGVVLLLSSHLARTTVVSGIDEAQVIQLREKHSQPETNAEPQQLSTRMGDRYDMWVKTIEILPNYMFIGAGLASFARVYDRHWKPVNVKNWQGLGDPHNQYLKIVVELGALGLIGFVAFLLAVINTGLKQQFLRGAAVAAPIIWCFTSLFSSHFTTFHEGHFIWLFLGVFLASNTDIYKT
jgi:O-antigen ligase